MIQPLPTHKYSGKLLLFVITGAVLFNLIFWKEKLAINTVLFTVFTVSAITIFYKDALKNRYAKWLLLAVVCTLSMVVVFNSVISNVASITAIVLFTAYCKYQHRSPVYAMGSALQTFLRFIPQFLKDVRASLSQKRTATAVFKKFRFIVLPLLLVLLFFCIYSLANKVFADITTAIMTRLEEWILPLINWIEPQRLLFLLLGICISGGLLYRYYNASFEASESLQSDGLVRNKSVSRRKYPGTWQSIVRLFVGSGAGGNLALKYEYKAGMLSLVILNVLLLIVNSTDVVYLWMGTTYKPGFEWPAYVHEGAEILVFSILLAMLVVLFFFRGNLNFFAEKKRLQQIAYIWLVQNAFLTLSVCIRNYYYIMHMGIAYKRIGLFVFALLVFAGLLSVFIKIRHVKTGYYLVKFNATVALTVFLICTFVQWDVVIARFNLQRKDIIPVDVSFLLTLSDHALPVLVEYKDFLNSQQTPLQRRYYFDYDTGKPGAELEKRISDFLYKSKQHSWLSWNWADARTKQELLKKTSLAIK